jgi:hypothetical protein
MEDKSTLILSPAPNPAPNTISFHTGNSSVDAFITLCENGDIFIKGKLIENDKEVVEGMREFLKLSTKK